MRHWSQLGIRNWRAKPGRTAGGLAAIALGVGVVIWVTSAYESLRLALEDQVWLWTGRAHLSVESAAGLEGTIAQSFTQTVRGLPNVEHVTEQLRYRAQLLATRPGAATMPAETSWDKLALPGTYAWDVQAVGVDPVSEQHFRQYDPSRITGRTLRPGETGKAIIDSAMAAQAGLKVGDHVVVVERRPDLEFAGTKRHLLLEIVGLVEHHRVAKQQLPIVVTTLPEVQRLGGFDGAAPEISKIDIILKDSSDVSIRRSESQLRGVAQPRGYLVTSAVAKLRQVRAAEQQTSFVLLILSTVALFTAFFVILSTLSMGMVERVGLLGMLRCLGMTRTQIAGLVLAEAIPVGLVGILLGIPVGLGLARLSVWLVPDYIGTMAINRTGLLLALGGGALTTLIGSILPMLQAMRVSPLAASRPQSTPPRRALVWVAALAGLLLIGGHAYLLRVTTPDQWFRPVYGPLRAVLMVFLLYGGYAMITPALVRIIGQATVGVVAVLLGVRQQLLSDQVGRATWRSAAICCGLMVGLSLIVSLLVNSKSLAAGWDFPKHFCEAFVHVAPPVERAKAEMARRIPGVGSSALVNVSTKCRIDGRGWLRWDVSRFISGDPDEFFNIARLEFLKGEKDEAIAKLRQGGHVLVTPEFERAQRVTLGDRIAVTLSGQRRPYNYVIAGVVTSPALDIAANYFNAGGQLAATSALVVLGTQADLKKMVGGRDEISMFLINFNLPETEPPPEFQADRPPPISDLVATMEMVERWRPAMLERARELTLIRQQYERAPKTPQGTSWAQVPMLAMFRSALSEQVFPGWSKATPLERWRAFREELTLRLVPAYAGAADEQHKSVRALKAQIDRDLNRATLIITAIPTVALIVAALGVGNLMMANVTSRTRQIALLRAVGATKWQVTRLIIGEAVVLGALGSLLGLGLGFHAASGMNGLVASIWGLEPKFTVPWGWVSLGIGFTVGVCLIAGIIPARHAARNNIIDAMQTT